MSKNFDTLVPGYVQVDAFGPDDEYETDSEEVSYVTLDLGKIDPTLLPGSTTYRLIGLDSPTPFLQLAGTVFKGRHDQLLGTELLFTHANDGSVADAVKRPVEHLASTRQRISFKQVELRPKNPPPGQGNGDPSTGTSIGGPSRPESRPHFSWAAPKPRGRGGRPRGRPRGSRRGRGRGRGPEEAPAERLQSDFAAVFDEGGLELTQGAFGVLAQNVAGPSSTPASFEGLYTMEDTAETDTRMEGIE